MRACQTNVTRSQKTQGKSLPGPLVGAPWPACGGDVRAHRRHVHEAARGNLLAEGTHDVDMLADDALCTAEIAVLHDEAPHVFQGVHLGGLAGCAATGSAHESGPRLGPCGCGCSCAHESGAYAHLSVLRARSTELLQRLLHSKPDLAIVAVPVLGVELVAGGVQDHLPGEAGRGPRGRTLRVGHSRTTANVPGSLVSPQSRAMGTDKGLRVQIHGKVAHLYWSGTLGELRMTVPSLMPKSSWIMACPGGGVQVGYPREAGGGGAPGTRTHDVSQRTTIVAEMLRCATPQPFTWYVHCVSSGVMGSSRRSSSRTTGLARCEPKSNTATWGGDGPSSGLELDEARTSARSPCE